MKEAEIARMRERYPATTKRLERALAEADRLSAAGDYALHTSIGLTRETLVEPVLDAIGFGDGNRRNETWHPARCWLEADGATVALLICLPLDELRDTGASAAELRHSTGFGGPIIYTTGVQWRTHEGYTGGRVIDFHNVDLACFEPLVAAGGPNRPQEEAPRREDPTTGFPG